MKSVRGVIFFIFIFWKDIPLTVISFSASGLPLLANLYTLNSNEYEFIVGQNMSCLHKYSNTLNWLVELIITYLKYLLRFSRLYRTNILKQETTQISSGFVCN